MNGVERTYVSRTTRTLTWLLGAVMAAQSVAGLVLPGMYRDTGWVRSTWFGNDLVTLLLGLPLLLAGLALARRGSVRGLLLWCAGLAFAAYNYGFYLFGAALNALFPLYVAGFVAGMTTLGMVLAATPVSTVAQCFSASTPARRIGGFLGFLGLGLGSAWLAQWAAYVFGGKVPPAGVAPFSIVAAMDLSFVVPFMVLGAILVWRRRPWGYVIATVMSIKGASYMVVLAVNSARLLLAGSESAASELAVWGGVGAACFAAAAVMLASVREDRLVGAAAKTD